jgi:hypothetical protein
MSRNQTMTVSLQPKDMIKLRTIFPEGLLGRGLVTLIPTCPGSARHVEKRQVPTADLPLFRSTVIPRAVTWKRL